MDTKPSSGGTDTVLASSITHKPFGPITGFTYGNSEALTKTYDNNYWLSTLNTVYSGTYVQELSYTQDNAGNLTAITDTLDSTRDESFGVDNLDRLHTASGKYGSRTYTYDNNSNRATEVIGGGATYTYTNTSSKNLLASYTDGTNTRHFTYTANGNMATDDRTFIGGGSVSNTFGGRDRLESQTVNSQAVTFTVNAFGQRASKAFSGTTTDYIRDIRGNIIAEADGGTGSTNVEYVWMEGQLLAQIDSSGNIVYVHNDYVNNPQKITNPSRTLVWDRIQEPFGEDSSTPTNTTPTNHRFPGQYFDAANSLNYNNARNYDRSIGRYIEADPSSFRGGYNLYAYASDNPTEMIDPWGQQTLSGTPVGNGIPVYSGAANVVASENEATQADDASSSASDSSQTYTPEEHCSCDPATFGQGFYIPASLMNGYNIKLLFDQNTGLPRTGSGYTVGEIVIGDPGTNYLTAPPDKRVHLINGLLFDGVGLLKILPPEHALQTLTLYCDGVPVPLSPNQYDHNDSVNPWGIYTGSVTPKQSSSDAHTN